MKELSVADLAKALRESPEKVTLIDVREQGEWDQVRVDGATLMPLSQWPAIAEQQLPKNGTYHMMCAAGVRSARAAEWMMENGYGDVINVTGGMKAWLMEGLPVEG